MMKLYILFSVVAFAALLNGCKGDYTSPVLVSKRTAAPPVLDGIPDPLWQKAGWDTLKNVDWTKKKKFTNKDFSVRYKSVYDRENCYFFVEFTDDKPFRRNFPVSEMEANYDWAPYQNDCIEFYFDTSNNKADSVDTKHRFTYRFIYDTQEVYDFSKLLPLHNGVKFAQKNTSSGYDMEIQIPWKTLNFKGIPPKRALALEVIANDNDNHVPEQGMLSFIETSMSWSEPGVSTWWYQSKNFGDLKLR